MADYVTLHCCWIVACSFSRGVFYFGHAESIVPVFAALGLFRDPDPLRADTFADRSLAEKRKFRTSAFVPFSANIAFLLHDCSEGHGPATKKGQSNVVDGLLDGAGDHSLANISAANRFYVQLVLNERPMKFPSLCGGSICSYVQLRKFLSSYIDRCYFREKCELATET